MVISRNSQLGLMMDDENLKIEFLELMMERNVELRDAYDMIIGVLKHKYDTQIDDLSDTLEKVKSGDLFFTEEEVKLHISKYPKIENVDSFDLPILQSNSGIADKIRDKFLDTTMTFVDNDDSKLYLICEGIEKCSKMIRIGDNFSSKALRNIKFGKHTYLLGKNEMCRFLCEKGAIKGVYWDREKKICFEFGFDLEEDGYYFDKLYADQFNKVAKIITFVELGDIDIIELNKGRNNGKPKSNGKVTNTSEYTVFVVDSTWNQLIIRTDGFAVMGHFRLQPCGVGFIDRKLIWINAFEKHGYTRKPKASIIHD